MARMSRAKLDSDQNGSAGIISSCARALAASAITPTQRENWFLMNTPQPTASSITPMQSTIQPQVLRLAKNRPAGLG